MERNTPTHLKRFSLQNHPPPAAAAAAAPPLVYSSPTLKSFRPSSISYSPTPTYHSTHTRSLSSRSNHLPSSPYRLPPPSIASTTIDPLSSSPPAPTVEELTVRLLQVIARKEAVCLELRLELRKNEDELARLKSKYESIISKSIIAKPSPAAPNFSLPVRPNPSPNLTSASSTFPTPSTSPHPGATDHHSTFAKQHHRSDSTNGASASFGSMSITTAQNGDLEIELGESVDLAKKWIGGLFSKVVHALPSDPAWAVTNGNERKSGRIDQKRGSIDDRTSEEIAQITGVDHTDQPPSSSSDSTSSPSSNNDFLLSDLLLSPLSSSLSATSSPNTSPTMSARLSPSTAPVKAAAIESATPSRSSIRALSTVVEGNTRSPTMTSSSLAPKPTSAFAVFDTTGWTSLGKRWTGLTESETFQSSKRATLSLVDSLERSIAETLGPLDPPPLSPPTSMAPPPRSSHRRTNSNSTLTPSSTQGRLLTTARSKEKKMSDAEEGVAIGVVGGGAGAGGGNRMKTSAKKRSDAFYETTAVGSNGRSAP